GGETHRSIRDRAVRTGQRRARADQREAFGGDWKEANLPDRRDPTERIQIRFRCARRTLCGAEPDRPAIAARILVLHERDLSAAGGKTLRPRAWGSGPGAWARQWKGVGLGPEATRRRSRAGSSRSRSCAHQEGK